MTLTTGDLERLGAADNLAKENARLRAALELAKQHEHHPGCGLDGFECGLCKQIDAALSSSKAV